VCAAYEEAQEGEVWKVPTSGASITVELGYGTPLAPGWVHHFTWRVSNPPHFGELFIT
jgi:hypothetical protein